MITRCWIRYGALKQAVALLCVLYFVAPTDTRGDKALTEVVIGISISEFHNPAACEEVPPKDLGDQDALRHVADQILAKIDPRVQDDFKQTKIEYQEQIEEIAPEFAAFWNKIPASSRRYVDIDNDGTMELFVTSIGMDPRAWSFGNFIALLDKKRDEVGYDTDQWELMYLKPLPSYFKDEALAVRDIDQDGRPDLLFTFLTPGGSQSPSYLYIFSLNRDMEMQEHEKGSILPIRILEPNALRPIFLLHEYDAWRDDDYGASVRARGPRKLYYHWTTGRGFVEQ